MSLSPSSNGSLGETCFLNVDSLKKSVLSRHGTSALYMKHVFPLKYLPPNEIYSPAMEVPEAEEDVDLSLVILSDAFFESKLLSTVLEAWFFCVSHRLLRRTNPYNIFAVKTCVNCVVGELLVQQLSC